jgi:hypothetical protein
MRENLIFAPKLPFGVLQRCSCIAEQEAPMSIDLPDPHQAFEVYEVRAIFHSSDAMQHAISQLTLHGFGRADLSLPDIAPTLERAPLDAGAKAADADDDAQQGRTLGTGTTAAVGAMAAAGITVATGGAAGFAIAAAAAVGSLLGGATYAVTSVVNAHEHTDREDKAATGSLILSARAPTAEKRAQAEMILRSSGGTDIWTS